MSPSSTPTNLVLSQDFTGISDPYFNNVVLLLNGDGTNGAQNNTFIDNSTNNFTITRNGNVTQGSFSPYGDRWSAFFDGSGDYLSIPDNNTWAFAGDFTVEAWVHPTSLGAERIIISQWFGGTTANTAFTIDFQSTNKVRAIFSSGGTMATINSSSTYTANTWYHIAAVRSGSTITLYVNGLSEGTVALSGAINNIAYPLYIGVLNDQGALASPFVGYISNARILNGTALYTSNFTPPTSPLAAITNTSLLTCHANRFVDGSSNNFTITRNGDTRVERFSPFAPSAAYSSNVIGGSAYFDGTNTATNLNIGTPIGATDDFTISFWYYLDSFTTSGGTATVIPLFNNLNWFNQQECGIQIRAESTSIISMVATGGGAVANPPNTLLTVSATIAGTWNHIVLVRDGATVRLFVNGIGTSGTLSSNTGLNHATRDLYVGGWFNFQAGAPSTTRYAKGFISDLRIVNSALYSANFTPPTTPSTAISGTSRLLSATNAGIIDATAGNVLETVGNAQVSTVQKQYGTGALYFDGTGDRIRAISPAAFEFGTGDFTIECWAYPVSFGSGFTLYIHWNGNQAFGRFGLSLQSSGVSVDTLNGMGLVFSGSTTITTGSWYHIAVTRSGNIFRTFVNGAQISTATSSAAYSPTGAPLNIGDYPDDFATGYGYIDDLRITKGVARYTAHFTPPVSALPLL